MQITPCLNPMPLPPSFATWQRSCRYFNSERDIPARRGSHTVPASVSHAFSLSNSVVPTTGFQGVASQFSNGGHPSRQPRCSKFPGVAGAVM
jgi:hypothetical protein